ncbi:MAG: DinB family protein [Acidobacteria bacterium]|nr:DinB family protein [Acidobacteriota bacterium]
MNPEELRTLVDFHYWARDRLLEVVEPLSPEQFTRDMGSSFRSVRDTLAHIYSAEWIWFSRWQGESPAAMPASDTFPDLASIRAAWKEHESRMNAFLNRLDARGIDQRLEYKTTAGQPMASVLWRMVQHVVNHASYHRGQVTTMLRQLGAAPPKSMDLIAFYRERGA